MTRPRLSVALLLGCCVAVAGCANNAATTAQPTAVAATAEQTAAPTAATVEQTAAPATVVAAQPTIAATPIPAPPQATPFPLAAGWWDSGVCYEVFVRSFYDSNGDGIGDINGLIEKLDYINDGKPETRTDLGANCMWLMPIMASPSYHGYDTTDYYAVNPEYGTNDDFKRLVDEAHKRGITILLDLVLNHSSNQHPWFKDAASNPASPYRDWFIWSPTKPDYKSPWGTEVWHKSPGGNEYYYGLFSDTQPDLNYRNPAVTAEAQKISSFWLKDMGADGFRLDAIKHLIEDGTVQENTPETIAWLRSYRTYLEQNNPGAFTVGEVFDATPNILAPYYPDQLDEYFIFDIGSRIIAAATTGNGKQFTSAVQRVNDTLPYQRYSPFLTNHDQNRVMGLLGSTDKAKVAAIALLTIPGLPFVYYGEEIGMIGAKPDPQIRTPMQWAGDANGGFTTGKPWEALQPNAADVNVAAQDGDTASLLNTYRTLINLHTTNPALGQGDFSAFESSDRGAAAFVRQSGEEAVLVLINFDGDPVDGATFTLAASSLAPGTYKLETLYGDGTGADLAVSDGGSVNGYAPIASVPARTGYVFKLVKQ